MARAGFRLFWRRGSPLGRLARAAFRSGVIALIKRVAAENRLWGAERIRGELLKLGVRGLYEGPLR
jgi:putative transposase